MPLDIITLQEWKAASNHWSQNRSSHTSLREMDTALEQYHAVPKQNIEDRIRALNKIMVLTEKYVATKQTGSVLLFLRTRREKKVEAAEFLRGQAQAKVNYLAGVLGAERNLPALFGAGASTPMQSAGTAQERWVALAKEIYGLQKYIGTPGQGRVLHEDYWTEAIDPLHRNWHHPTNSPIFAAWTKARHVDKSTGLSFYRWFETLTDQDLKAMAPAGLLATAYQDAVGREQFRVYLADGRLKKLTKPDEMTDFSTATYKTNFAGPGWCIFVISTEGNLYANNHDDTTGWFHAAFMGGKPVIAAGELYAKNGILHAMTPKSGHYKPRPTDLIAGLNSLRAQGLDLSQTQVMNFKIGPNGKGLLGRGGGTVCNWYDAVPFIDSGGAAGLIRAESIAKDYRQVWDPQNNKPVKINGEEWLNKARWPGWTNYPNV